LKGLLKAGPAQCVSELFSSAIEEWRMAGAESAELASTDEGLAITQSSGGADGNADPDTPPGVDRGRGSRRRSQWVVQPRGAIRADAADDPGVTRPTGPLSRRVRGWVPLVVVVAVLLLVVGLSVASGAGRRPGAGTPVAAARSTDTGANPGAIVPLTGISSPPSSASSTASPTVSRKPTTSPSTAGAAQAGSTGTAMAQAAAKGSALPQPIGSWRLNSGSGTVAVDTVGHHNGVATNITWVGAAAEFDGKTSDITVPEPVVDTGPGKSFTIAAWVYLWSNSAFATAVSQDGTVNAGFFLEFSAADDRWAFARQALDNTSSTPHRALSAAAPALNTWTPLVGVFDGATNTLLLYVNGQLQGASTDPSPYATHGSLVFGRSIAGGGYGAWFPGLIDDVEVFDKALTNAQIQALGTYE
jgi:hypothetical protein